MPICQVAMSICHVADSFCSTPGRWTATASALGFTAEDFFAEAYSGPVVKNSWTFTPRALAAFAMIRSAVATTSNPAASATAR